MTKYLISPHQKKKKKNDGIKNILERDGGDDCTRM
jgi:hypothetical protein